MSKMDCDAGGTHVASSDSGVRYRREREGVHTTRTAVIELSLLNNNHFSISRRLLEAMRKAGSDDIPVVIGGIIPPEDVAPLLELGIAGVFPVHTPPSEIVDRIRKVVASGAAAKEH